MEGICTGKGIVIEMKFISGLFPYKTRGSCVYNETTEKRKFLQFHCMGHYT